MIPNTTPPSVDFATAGSFSRPNSRGTSIMDPARSVTTRAANRSRGIPALRNASSCWAYRPARSCMLPPLAIR